MLNRLCPIFLCFIEDLLNCLGLVFLIVERCRSGLRTRRVTMYEAPDNIFSTD